MGGFSTVGGGAEIATTFGYTANVIKNLDFARARPEDIVYAMIPAILGIITYDDLAKFIDTGVSSYNQQNMWANIISQNPFSVWPVSPTAAVLNSVNMSTASAAKILGSPYMSISVAATILNDPNLPPSRIKAILADTNISADKVQSILYAMVDNGYYDKLLQILTFDAPSSSITASTTLTTGVNRYYSLSIASGVTLTLGAGPGVIIADTVSNSGTIASGWVKGAGGAPGVSGAGAGGGGAGGIIILARNVTVGTITANGGAGGAGSTVAATANGGAGGGGLFWVISGDTVPRGGSGGGAGGAGNPNSGGGGGTSARVGGAGGSATVVSYPSATALLADLLKAAVDWWIINVLGKSPTSTKSFPSLGGSGGGGGAAEDGYGACGGGGGGGGEVIVFGLSVTAGTINAAGGNGGNGGTEGSYDTGGGGGGGGVVYVFYRSPLGMFTFNVAGGSGGTGDAAGAAGGTGVAKAIAV